jgi:hypothetical protein
MGRWLASLSHCSTGKGRFGAPSHYGGDPILSLKNWPFERGSDTGPSEIAVTRAIKLRKIITRKTRSIPHKMGGSPAFQDYSNSKRAGIRM